MKNTLFSLLLFVSLTTTLMAQESVTIDGAAQGSAFPHFWEQMFGSGRAILSLRQSYRDDLKAVKAVTDFKYVRFHAILHDEVGVYNEDDHGNAVYNFAYVDQIYDGLLQNGVKPLVEISFMPKKLAFNPDALHPFWYKPNVSPTKSYEKWDDLIRQFGKHLVDRYGIEEVSTWYFEVWNEPNIDFWGGIPRQKSYFELYDHTVTALKGVSPRIRVGGPATAAAEWVDDFLKHTADNNIPVDFVSTHAYADDTVENLFHTNENIEMDDRVCRAVAKVRDQIKASSKPQLPLLWTEWNVIGMMEARDTPFVGPALANTVRECDGMVDMMSFWTFSDVFEEGGPAAKPFVGMFGLRAEGGINKPSFYDFALMHQLGNQRLANESKNVLVTRRQNGDLAIAAWNLVDPDKQGGPTSMDLTISHVRPDAEVSIQRVDDDHGNPLKKFAALGSPLYPTPEQVKEMNTASTLPAPEQAKLKNGKLSLQLAKNALLLITIRH
jgi:xylan 1,4-beta-xylosidase